MRTLAMMVSVVMLVTGLLTVTAGAQGASVVAGESTDGDRTETDLAVAVERVLRARPELVFSVLEHHPVLFADLVDRAAAIRKVKAEEDRWRAELKHPKVPAIEENRPIRGTRQAPITIVEYSDFECPYCRAVAPTLHDLLSDYGDRVRLVYKHNPLSFHPTAEPAARYFEAIALQSEEQAWRFHDHVFDQQHSLAQGVEALKDLAGMLDIDQEQLARDLHSAAVDDRLTADRAEAERFGFDGTPAFLINGVSLIGNHPKQDFDHIIKLFLPDTQAMAR